MFTPIVLSIRHLAVLLMSLFLVSLACLRCGSFIFQTTEVRVSDQTTPSVSPAQAVLNNLELCLKDCPYDVKDNHDKVSDDLDDCVQECNDAATTDAITKRTTVPASVGTTILPCVDKCSDRK
jgi:hypothetical protein